MNKEEKMTEGMHEVELDPRSNDVIDIIVAISKASASDEGKVDPIKMVVDASMALAIMMKTINMEPSNMRMVFSAAVKSCPDMKPISKYEGVKFGGIAKETAEET